MKTYAILFLMLLGLCAKAANPSFQQFNTNDFVVVDKVSVSVNTNKFATTNNLNGYVEKNSGSATNLTLLSTVYFGNAAPNFRTAGDVDNVRVFSHSFQASDSSGGFLGSGANLTSLPASQLTGSILAPRIASTNGIAEQRWLTIAGDGATMMWTNTLNAWQLSGTWTNAALHNPQAIGTLTVSGAGDISALRVYSPLNGAGAQGVNLSVNKKVTITSAAGAGLEVGNGASDNTGRYYGGSFVVLSNLRVGGDLNLTNSLTVLGGITNAGPLILGQITEPVPGTDKAGVYAADVSGTAEVFVVDEAGNETQISPHAMNSPGIASDTNALPIILHHRNRYSGEQEWLHLSKLARAVEKLTGEQIIYSQPLPQNRRRNWQADQNQFQADYDARRAAALEAFNAGNTNITVPPARDIRQPEPPIARRGGGRP